MPGRQDVLLRGASGALVAPVVVHAAAGAGTVTVTTGSGGGAAWNDTITHGYDLEIGNVGPWSLQGVARGSQSIQVMALPSRGYWKMDEPSEYAPTGTYVYNRLSTNHGGVVGSGGITLTGMTLNNGTTSADIFLPAGTIVVQYRDFSAGDFSAQGQSGSYCFIGCVFRGDGIGQSSQFNDFTSTYTNRQLYCDMGGMEPAALAHWQMPFWKMIGGQNHVMFRNYCSAQYVTYQLNVNNPLCIENYITDLTWYYGETAPPGQGGEPLHMSSVGSQGGVSGHRVLRNVILCPSPDPLGTVFTQGAALTFGNDIDVAWSDVWIKDNYLSGMGFVIRLFGEYPGQNNLQVTGNYVSSKWFTNGGASGVAQLGDNPVVWGSSGNVKSGNIWIDDYGTGGNGNTPTSSRQYPAGNGPRVGTEAF